MGWRRCLQLAAVSFLLVPAWCQEDGDDETGGEADIEDESLSGEQLRGLHAKFDGNGDGKVSFQEVMDYSTAVSKDMAARDISSILDEIDASKDGRLSLEEHLDDVQTQSEGADEEEARELQQRKEVERAKFAAADDNGDQLLDKAELAGLFYPEVHRGVLDITVQEAMRQKDSDRDGKLSPAEFWDIDPSDGDNGDMLEEERADFGKLDADGDGFLNAQELSFWESGRFHIEDAMKKLFEISDADSDMYISADELVAAREQVAATDAQFHLIEWAEHHEL